MVEKFAIRMRFKTSEYTSDGKWHKHTTKWYDDLSDAWDEAEKFQADNSKIIMECACAAIHKGVMH